jgi:hypothetical protein
VCIRNYINCLLTEDFIWNIHSVFSLPLDHQTFICFCRADKSLSSEDPWRLTKSVSWLHERRMIHDGQKWSWLIHWSHCRKNLFSSTHEKLNITRDIQWIASMRKSRERAKGMHDFLKESQEGYSDPCIRFSGFEIFEVHQDFNL